jgi:hypothetical protein
MKDEMTPDSPQGSEGSKPKRPTRDYSDVPQRPIKLKNDIGGLVLPRPKASAPAAKKSKVKAKPRTARTRTKKAAEAKVKPALQGISDVALEAAANAAREEGMPLDRWVEQAILHALVESETQEPPEPPEPIVIESPDMKLLNQRLQEITRHLERIEKQKGFWTQLWERLITEGRS